MDIAFDRNGWTKDPADQAGGPPAAPEWHGLLARLAAARGARSALAEQTAADKARKSGSFDCPSARALAEYGSADHPSPLLSVNPVPWADGKPARASVFGVAGEANPGDRG